MNQNTNCGICPIMNGNKCALNYCDFYEEEDQICSKASLTKKRLGLLKKVEIKLEELIDSAKDKDVFLAKLAALQLNLMGAPKTIQ